MPRHPNVLFILSDQHNAKFLGATGMTDVVTPNLDRMAAEGVRFESAVTMITICGPSRVCFLSGQYPHNSGRYGFGGPKPECPPVFAHFRAAGYHTASLGKMHCPHYWLEEHCDEYYETDRTSVGGSCREYLDYLKQRGVDIYREYELEPQPSPFAYADSQEGWSARRTVEVIKNSQAAGKPFFVHLSLTKPHQPYTPAKKFWDLYDDRKIHLPPNADYDLKAARKALYMMDLSERTRAVKDFESQRLAKLHGYLGNVTHCDQAVGDVLAYLDEAGLAEDTIVVYSADHGEYACEHGPGEKVPGICADAVTAVPLLWRWAGHLRAGHVATEMAESVDVVSTLCSLSGVGAMTTCDGKDLTPILNGQRGELRTIAVTEYPLTKAVRKGKWRLVYYPPGFFGERHPGPFGELYDLAADPWEMKNLYFDPACAAKVREIERDLLDWLCSTGRPVTAYTPITTPTADGKITPQDLWSGTPCGAYL